MCIADISMGGGNAYFLLCRWMSRHAVEIPLLNVQRHLSSRSQSTALTRTDGRETLCYRCDRMGYICIELWPPLYELHFVLCAKPMPKLATGQPIRMYSRKLPCPGSVLDTSVKDWHCNLGPSTLITSQLLAYPTEQWVFYTRAYMEGGASTTGEELEFLSRASGRETEIYLRAECCSVQEGQSSLHTHNKRICRRVRAGGSLPHLKCWQTSDSSRGELTPEKETSQDFCFQRAVTLECFKSKVSVVRKFLC